MTCFLMAFSLKSRPAPPSRIRAPVPVCSLPREMKHLDCDGFGKALVKLVASLHRPIGG
jgi:hypothetical protein